MSLTREERTNVLKIVIGTFIFIIVVFTYFTITYHVDNKDKTKVIEATVDSIKTEDELPRGITLFTYRGCEYIKSPIDFGGGIEHLGDCKNYKHHRQ